MIPLDPRIIAYYERGLQLGRLSGAFPSGPLEFERTWEILMRYLPAAAHLLAVGQK